MRSLDTCRKTTWNGMRRIKQGMAIVLGGLAVSTGLLAGCNTPQPKEATSATSVIITNRTSEEIKAAATETFKRHEYEPVPGDGADLAFQKRGTFMNDLMSPDWFDGPSWVKVRVYQYPLDAERTRLDCEVYLVQQPEDPLFKQERRYGGHRKDFRNLMHEIAQSLRRPVDQPHQ